jgi:hypothetical protein
MADAIATIAAEQNVPVFHRFAAMEHWISSGQLTFKKMLSKDGLHMMDASYLCLAELLTEMIASGTRAASQSAATETPIKR